MKTKLIPNKTLIYDDSKTLVTRLKTCRICAAMFVDLTHANRRTLCGESKCWRKAMSISASESRDRRIKGETK